MLAHYGVTNTSALRLGAHERRWPTTVAVGGLVGCAVLTVSLPIGSAVAAAIVLAAGMAGYAVVVYPSRSA